MSDTPKPLIWIGSSLKELRSFPEEVKDLMGYALHLAQAGYKHAAAKPLAGFGSAGVLEVVDDYDGDTYRAVYTVKFVDRIYVLHAFQKKAKKGDQDAQTGFGACSGTSEVRRGGPRRSCQRKCDMKERAIQEGSGNVFADLGFADPVTHKLKAELVRKLDSILEARGLSQSAAAPIVGVSQPDLSRLLNGRVRDVSVERLLRMLTRLDCEVDINVQFEGHSVGGAIRLDALAA